MLNRWILLQFVLTIRIIFNLYPLKDYATFLNGQSYFYHNFLFVYHHWWLLSSDQVPGTPAVVTEVLIACGFSAKIDLHLIFISLVACEFCAKTDMQYLCRSSNDGGWRRLPVVIKFFLLGKKKEKEMCMKLPSNSSLSRNVH